jgi:hypothetical protein
MAKADAPQRGSGPQPRRPVKDSGGKGRNQGLRLKAKGKDDIIRERRSLPMEQRQTGEQAETFAMQIKHKYKFSSDSADPYRTVRGWLLRLIGMAGTQKAIIGWRVGKRNADTTLELLYDLPWSRDRAA